VAVNVNSKVEILENCCLQLFDVYGNCIKEFDLPVLRNKNISDTIELKNMAKGVYIYRILNGGKDIYNGKLVVN